MNKSITLSFVQNEKMKEIILLYNIGSKSVTHYELNCEFKNLINDIAQIKKDVHEIHQAIHNNDNNINKNTDNKNGNFDFTPKVFKTLKDFVMDNTISLLSNQITNREKLISEFEKKIDNIKSLAKIELQKGNKIEAKKLVLKKKF